MRTPDEIKKGLYHCGTIDVSCTNCPYDEDCHTQGDGYCSVEDDALIYIERLESRLAEVERERDWLQERKLFLTHSLEEVEKERRAIKNDMENYCHHGSICKHFCEGTCPYPVEGCPLYPSDCEAYEWRGFCEENTHDQSSV